MGLVGGSRHYDGPALAPQAGWTCVACDAENTGPLEQGCALCGAGKPGERKESPAPAPVDPPRRPRPGDLDRFSQTATVHLSAGEWAANNPRATLAEAFVAGYMAAQAATIRAAAPVTADIAKLAPEAKTSRTIVAALRLFRDQVLVDAEDEIQSGEFCSLAEIDALIQQIEETSL